MEVYPSNRLLQNLNQPGISAVLESGKNIVYDPAQGTRMHRSGSVLICWYCNAAALVKIELSVWVVPGRCV
jgi:hypothetical protein